MRIGAIIVTYNRLELLKQTLQLFENQTKCPDYILVVNNNSSDGTSEFLNNWRNECSTICHKVLSLPENIGGSGGFSAGINEALKYETDWMWLSDDDAFPSENCFEILEQFSNERKDENISAFCTQNINIDGVEYGHRCINKRKFFAKMIIPVGKEKYLDDCFECDYLSFVGALIKTETIKKIGTPKKDFFIYGDDYEYSIRIRQQGKIICVPGAIINHKTHTSSRNKVTWRDYYETRNIIWIYYHYFDGFSCFVRKTMRMSTALRSLNGNKIRAFREAIKDAKHNQLGINDMYKP